MELYPALGYSKGMQGYPCMGHLHQDIPVVRCTHVWGMENIPGEPGEHPQDGMRVGHKLGCVPCVATMMYMVET